MKWWNRFDAFMKRPDVMAFYIWLALTLASFAWLLKSAGR